MLVMIIVVFLAAATFVPALQKDRNKVIDVSCSEKPLDVIVWRCQGFFDQLYNPTVYYADGRWSLADAETVNRPILFNGEDKCRSIPPGTVEYTPDAVIDGENISFDLLVSNSMGVDLAEVPYTIETRVEPRTSTWDLEHPGRDAVVEKENGRLYNFSAGEIREVRVHARLAVPPQNRSVKELIVVITDPEVMAADGSTVQPEGIPEGNLMIYIQSPDTVLPDPAPVRTQRPLTDAPGAPAWVDADRRIVQSFIENPDAVVVYERNETNSLMDYHIYRTDEGEFYVNDQSRRIDRAGFYESVKPATKVLIPQEEAESIARAYAERNYPKFSTRNMVLTEAKLLDHGAGGKEYSFGWQEQVFGVANGNFVMICVATEHGEILTYLSRDRTVSGITEPKIPKEQAVETAVKEFTEVYGLSGTEGLEISARASVVPFLQDRVMWIVDLHIDLPEDPLGHRGGEVYVDAETGEMVLFNPCQ